MESAEGMDTYHLNGVATFFTPVYCCHCGIHIEALSRIRAFTEWFIAGASRHSALTDIVILII